MARGALDHRLKTFNIATGVAEQVIREHDCSDQRECSACGYRPSKKQPVCPSQSIAEGLVRGRRPWWHATPQPRNTTSAESVQDGLFPNPTPQGSS